jgi:hypothetical protein
LLKVPDERQVWTKLLAQLIGARDRAIYAGDAHCAYTYAVHVVRAARRSRPRAASLFAADRWRSPKDAMKPLLAWIARWLDGNTVRDFDEDFFDAGPEPQSKKAVGYIVKYALRDLVSRGMADWQPVPNGVRRVDPVRIYLDRQEARDFAKELNKGDKTYQYKVTEWPLPVGAIPGQACRYCKNPATAEVMVFAPADWNAAPKSEDHIRVFVCAFCRRGNLEQFERHERALELGQAVKRPAIPSTTVQPIQAGDRMRYASICPNCNQHQDPPAGDCINECVKAGLAVAPRMVHVEGRKDEVCLHAEVRKGEGWLIVPSETGEPHPSALCWQCGNVVELVRETVH